MQECFLVYAYVFFYLPIAGALVHLPAVSKCGTRTRCDLSKLLDA